MPRSPRESEKGEPERGETEGEAGGSSPSSAELAARALQHKLGMRSRYLAARLLAALAADGGPVRSQEDFDARAASLLGGTVDDKLRFLFNLYDDDGSGLIELVELERMLHIELAENEILLRPEDADRLVRAMLYEADLDRGQSLSFPEFRRLIEQRPELCERLAEKGVMLLRPQHRRVQRREDRRVVGWVRHHGLLGLWVGLLAAANIVLFVTAFMTYREQGANLWIQLARGCGACLNLDGPLLLVPMLRHLWSAARRTVLGRVLPLDETISLHRWIGELVFVLSIVHTAAHLINVAVGATAADELLLSAPYLSGAALLVVLLLIWACARDSVRAGGRFELFHRVHMAYWLWFAIAVFHGPVFWIWLLGPGLLFIGEQLIRARQRSDSCHLLEATALPGGVTKLRFDRPLGFEYEAGDFIYLRVPAVARSEWHPFTLTSAPEDPDWLSVHVRTLGNWTRALAERFAIAGSERGERVFVDGPYGTPSAHIWECEHAVAIAAGIGVTPFASILQSLHNRHTARQRRRRGKDNDNDNDNGLALKKLHFVWICREQASFAWFRQLLGELEACNDGWLDIQIYFTSARTDMTGGIVDLARAILRESGSVDIVTGLRARTHFGRPDLQGLLAGFVAEPGLARPDVFFCGPPGLARGLARTCVGLELSFRFERF